MNDVKKGNESKELEVLRNADTKENESEDSELNEVDIEGVVGGSLQLAGYHMNQQ